MNRQNFITSSFVLAMAATPAIQRRISRDGFWPDGVRLVFMRRMEIAKFALSRRTIIREDGLA